MAIGQIEGTDQKGHVDPAGAQVHDCFVRRSFRHVDTDVGILFAVPRQQIVEKAASDQAMEADEQVAALFQCGHVGGFHGVVELVNAGRDLPHETLVGFRRSTITNLMSAVKASADMTLALNEEAPF